MRTIPRALLELARGGGAFLLAGILVPGCGRESARACFDDGTRHFERGEYAEAVADYEAGLALEPNSAVGHNLLGMACRMQYAELRDRAWRMRELTAFRHSVDADSTFWPAQINLGVTLYDEGRKREAAACFARALEIYPQNPERERIARYVEEGLAAKE